MRLTCSRCGCSNLPTASAGGSPARLCNAAHAGARPRDGPVEYLCVHHDTRLVVLARPSRPNDELFSAAGFAFPVSRRPRVRRVISAFQQVHGASNSSRNWPERAAIAQRAAAAWTNASKKSASAATTRVRATPSAASWISAFPFRPLRRSGLAHIVYMRHRDTSCPCRLRARNCATARC